MLTWKSSGAPFGPEEAPEAVFARAWGCSHGPAQHVHEIVNIAAEVGATRLFLGSRDQGRPDQVPPARQRAAEEAAAELELRLREAGAFMAGEPVIGETVLDVVCSPGEPSLVGWHTHAPGRHAGPCGRYRYLVPPDVPSRAYKKLVEGLLWSGVELRPGDHVLEIGAAPGGATLALLERGARVLAVDTSPLDPVLAGRPGLSTLKRAPSELRREDLPADLRWIVWDANVSPAHAVRTLLRLFPSLPGLQGLLMTLRLNDDASVDALPRLLDQIRWAGATTLRAAQLPANRRDVFVYVSLI